MIGYELKSDVVRNGLKIWVVAQRAELPYYRVSAIFSGRIAPTPNEIGSIRRAIISLSDRRVEITEKEGKT